MPISNKNITKLVTVSSSGQQAIYGPQPRNDISGDGRFIVFYSDAYNLVPGDTNGKYDIFIRDQLENTTKRISVTYNDNESNNYSGVPQISSNGQYIVFASDSTNLVELNDNNNASDIFIYGPETLPKVNSDIKSGYYNHDLNISLNSTPDSAIFYTTDNTVPIISNSRHLYSGELILINSTTTLKFAAVDSENNWSDVETETYWIDTIPPLVTPSLSSGNYLNSLNVTLTSNEPATIYYTIDNSIPNINSTKYTAPIKINRNINLKFIAIDLAGNISPVNTAYYDLNKELADSAWPMYGHDSNQTGISPNQGSPANTVKWNISWIANDNVPSPSVGADGTIYFGSDKTYAINPDGTLKWQYPIPAVGNPSIIQDGAIYFKNSNKIYALNGNGTLKWIYAAPDGITSSPVVGSDGTIYFVYRDSWAFNLGYICAINPDGSLQWKSYTGFNGSGYGQDYLSMDQNGTLYYASEYFSYPYLLALNSNGTEKWRYMAEDVIETSPVISNDGILYFIDDNAKLYAIDTNGTLKWKVSVGGGASGSRLSLGSDGKIYVVSYGYLKSVTPEGIVNTLYRTNSISYSKPIIDVNGTIYFTGGSYLYAVRSNGTLLWVTENLGDSLYVSNPAMGSDGTIYIGNRDHIYAIQDNVPPTVDANIKGGFYTSSQTIMLSAVDQCDPSPKIYFTLDGSDPTTSSTIYTDPIKIDSKKILKFMAVDKVNNISGIHTEIYNIVLEPVINYNIFKGFQTIQAAITDPETLNGHTILIRNGTYAGENNRNLNIDKNLTIVGESQAMTIIDAQGLSRIFNILSRVNVTIQNISFINGNATDGGAIYNQGNLTVENCTFTGNNATDGGAIYNQGNLTVESNNLTNNNASNGGAIYNDIWGTLTLHFSRIVGNTTQDIYNNYSTGNLINAEYNWWGSNNDPSGRVSGPVDISKWLVLNITASKTQIHTSDISIITVDLAHDNLGNYYDPALGHVPDGIPVILNCTLGTILNTFIMNGLATTTYTAGTKKGISTISATTDSQRLNTTIDIIRVDAYVSPTGDDTNGDGSQFNPFKTIAAGIAEVYTGGTIHIANGVYTGENNTNININKDMNIVGQSQTSTIINGSNVAQIFFINSGINVKIENLTITQGNLTYNGGAIFNNGSLIVNNILFTNNTAEDGGAIFNNCNCTIINCIIQNNTANGSGGAISNKCNCTVTNSIFQNNKNANAGYGGAIYNYKGNFTISNCTIQNSTSNYYGGGIYTFSGNCTITNCTIQNNTANWYGGGIFNDGYNDDNCTITNCTIQNNTANYAGGGIYNNDNCIVTGCTITENTAADAHNSVYGGGIAANAGNCTVTNCTIQRNFATGPSAYGGGIYNYDGNCTVNGCNIIENSATGSSAYGGGVSTLFGNCIINFNRIYNNNALTGNAIYLYNGSVNAEDNWWGSNLNPSSQFAGAVDYSPWLYMTLTANPLLIRGESTSEINVSFNNAYNGSNLTSINPAIDHIPDGIPVNFTTTLGNIVNPLFTVNGNIQSSLNGGSINGNTLISAILDLQSIDTSIIIDTISPTISSIEPSNNAKINATNKVITITFSEPIQVGSAYGGISVTGSSGTVLTDKNINGNVLTLTPISNYVDGSYSVDIPLNAVTDLAGNGLASSFALGFTVDATKPTVSANSTGGLFNTSQRVLLTAHDNLDPNPVISYTTDGTNWYPFTGPGTVLISKEGTTNLEFYAIDAAGNPSGHTTYSYTIDKTVPIVTVNPIGGIFNSDIDVSLSSESNATIYYKINNRTWNTLIGNGTASISDEGINSLEFYAIDAAGNPSAHTTYSYTIDKTIPVVTANLTSGLSKDPINVLLSSESDATIYYKINNGTWNTFIGNGTASISDEGINSLEFYAIDVAGNPSEHTIYSYTIDKTAPIVTASKTNGLSNNDIDVSLSSESDATIYYIINGGSWNIFTGNGNVLISNVGTNSLEFYAVDIVGNPSEHTIYSYTIDKTAPIAWANYKTGLYNTNKYITLNMGEPGTIYYTTNGITPTTASNKYTGPLSIISSTTLKFIAVDDAGNVSPVYTEKYTIDKTAPKVISTYPKRYATGVSRTSTIYIKFSEKIKASSYWSKIVVKDKYGHAVSISKSISGNVLYIKTKYKRSSYSYYTVYIPKAALKDYAGNNLAAGYTFKFKTGRY